MAEHVFRSKAQQPDEQDVRIDSPSRTQWDGKVGRAVKFDERDGMPYIAVQFPQVGHVVWFFESEFATALKGKKDA